jgi:NAD(P)-dependent dehydrogenase (short-subunit alcohol dehydrogenase family)
VANLTDLDRLFDTIKSKSDRLDIVFANAGGGEFVPLAEATEAHFDTWFGINVKGVLFTVQKALPLLNSGASIILCGSIVSVKGIEQFGVYNATKAAVRSLARTWAAELKGKNIRVNVVSPGPIKTPAIEKLTGSPQGADAMMSQMAAGIPLGRAGEPSEIAGAVTFLASSDASYVNGVELFVDGGMVQV